MANHHPQLPVVSLLIWFVRVLAAWTAFMVAISAFNPILMSTLGDAFRAHLPWMSAGDPAVEVPETVSARLDGWAPAEDCLDDQLRLEPPSPLEQEVWISGDQERIQVEVETTVARCSANFALINGGLGAALRDWNNLGELFLRRYIGTFELSGRRITMGVPDIIVDDRSTVRIRSKGVEEDVPLSSSAGLATTSLRWARVPEPRDARVGVTITLNDAGPVWASFATAVMQNRRESVFEVGGDVGMPIFLISFPAAVPESEAPPQPAPGSLVVRALRGGGIFSPLWEGIGYATPFVLLLLFGNRIQLPRSASRPAADEDSIAQCLRTSSAIVLSLIAGIAFAELAGNLVRAFLDGSRAFVNASFVARVMGVSLLISVLWPTLASHTEAPRPEKAGRTAFVAFVSLVLIVGFRVALESVSYADTFQLHSSIYRSISAGNLVTEKDALLLVLALASVASAALWVAREIGSSVGKMRVASVLVLGYCLLEVLDALELPPEVEVALLIAPFGWVLGRLINRGLAHVYTGTNRPAQLTVGWLCVAVVIVVSWPPLDMANPAMSWLLSSTARASIRVWEVLLIAILVAWFRVASRTPSAQLSGDLRAAGMTFMLAVFFWRPQSSVLPVIATFIGGVLILRHWVFASRPLAMNSNKSPLKNVLEKIARFQDVARAREVLRKYVLGEASRGQSTSDQLLSRLAEFDSTIGATRHAHTFLRGRLQLSLNAGGNDDPWQRAKYGALLSLIASLPWMVQYFVSLSRDAEVTTNAYAALQFVSIMFDIGRWPALGFFFLFFYPYIRGCNGIQKGLVLTVGLTSPQLVATMIATPTLPSAWLALLFWSLQVFICCMVVGVGAADLVVLNRAGRGVRSLAEIYNFTALTAWASTLAIAIGATATTALTTQVGQAIVAGLQLFLPSLQNAAR